MRLLPAISVLALVVSGVMSVMQGAELANIHSSVQQAAALVPDYGALMSRRIVLLAVALCLWIAPQLKVISLRFRYFLYHSFCFWQGINRSWRILWFAYDRGDGCRKLISNNRGFGPVRFYFCFVNVS